MQYVVNVSNEWRTISPEYVGSLILKQLRETGQQNLSTSLHRAVMAVPAEFDKQQRNYTKSAAHLAGDLSLMVNSQGFIAFVYHVSVSVSSTEFMMTIIVCF